MKTRPSSNGKLSAMATSRADAQSQLDSFLAKYDPEVSAFALRALTKMRKLVPGAIEMVYDNYNWLVIGFSPTERPSDAIFSLVRHFANARILAHLRVDFFILLNSRFGQNGRGYHAPVDLTLSAGRPASVAVGKPTAVKDVVDNTL